MKCLMTLALLMMTVGLSAREVALESVVCNPGSRVCVPVTLDDTQGLAVASFTVNYDPMVMTFAEAEEGTLKDLFSFDFTVLDETGVVTVVLVAPANITASRGGTLAELYFYVREGTEALYSDVALAEVELNEESMTLDLANKQTLTPKGAVVRSFATTSSCADRFGEGALCVAKETQLEKLSLRAGDVLSVSERQVPIVITDTLTTEGALRLRAPNTGWNGRRYEVLTTTNAAVTFAAADLPENYALTTEAADGVVTYVLTNTAVEPTIPIETAVDLSDADKDAIRYLLAENLEGITAITVNGSKEAIQVGLDLGIQPKLSRLQLMSADAASTLVAAFALPTLKVTAFDVKTGSIAVQVIPTEGATITKPVVNGVLHVHGGETLKTMSPLSNVEINVSDYLTKGKEGSVGFTLQLGDYSFFKVVVERAASESNGL